MTLRPTLSSVLAVNATRVLKHHVRMCKIDSILPVAADIHEADQGGRVGRHGSRGLWRHAVIALLPVHGESRAPSVRVHQ